MAVDKFLKTVIEWAGRNSFIEAIALVGSYARGEQREDSDIDLILISSQPEKLLNERQWLTEFGNYKDLRTESYGLITSLRVQYDFAEVEFGVGTMEWVKAASHDEQTKQVIQNGFRILYDPDSILAGSSGTNFTLARG